MLSGRWTNASVELKILIDKNIIMLTDLPEAARAYVRALEDAMECDIDIVSVGPEPEQTIRREVSKLSAWIEPGG